MKRRYTKRKHRNGKRPERKGSIKINLQQLPAAIDSFDFDRYCLHLEISHMKHMPDFPYLDDLRDFNTPEYSRKLRKYKQEIKKWRNYGHHLKYALDLCKRGNDFLLKNKQVEPADLAMDVINEVQPKILQKCSVLQKFCSSCKFKNDCPMKGLSDMWKEMACVFIPLGAVDRQWYAEEVEKPMDYTRNDTRLIAEAWEIPLS